MKYHSQKIPLLIVVANGTMRLNGEAARMIDAKKDDRWNMQISEAEALFTKTNFDAGYKINMYGVKDFYFGGKKLHRRLQQIYPHSEGVFEIEVKSKDSFTIKPYYG